MGRAEEEEPTLREAEAPSVAEATEGEAEAPSVAEATEGEVEAEPPRTSEAEAVEAVAPGTTGDEVVGAGVSVAKTVAQEVETEARRASTPPPVQGAPPL